MKDQKIHIIGGTGQMGAWLTSFLKDQGLSVTVSGKNKSNTKAIERADIIFFSVPVETVTDVMRETISLCKKEVLLIDLSSVMKHGQQCLKELGHPSASLHFLFGPNVTDITNQHVVFSPVLHEEAFTDLLQVLKDEGAQISHMSATEHDTMMAHIQALIHFSNLSLTQSLLHSGVGLTPETTTPTFLNQISVISRVLTNNSSDLFVNIQTQNPIFVSILEKHIGNQKQWLSLIKKKESEKLREAYDVLKKQLIPQRVEKKGDKTKDSHKVALPEHATLAYLGPAGTFSHQAAISILPEGTLTPEPTLFDIFKDVSDGKVRYGIIPAENSIEGTIRETLDYLVDFQVEVNCSYTLPVSHFLLSDEKELGAITRVFSHPQAIAQSRKWLQGHLPDVQLIPTRSTISDVEKERSISGSAFIGSEIAAKAYSLHALATNIEERKDNATKFYVIAKKETLLTVPTNRTLLFLSIFNRVGILKDILSVFASFDINLNKIESRPSREKVWDYYFFVEVGISRDDPRLIQILNMLRLFCPEIKILGQL